MCRGARRGPRHCWDALFLLQRRIYEDSPFGRKLRGRVVDEGS
jgi:hypothetical protein